MYKNIVNYLSYVPKHFVTAVAAMALVMAPLQIVAQETVEIEGDIGVANVTNGDTTYEDSVSAKVDEVVKIQVWYHNRENDDSGLVADNLKVDVDLPTSPGKNQTVKTTISSANSNTVVDSANVNLSLDNAFLEYIPGSAKWRHNAGTNDSPNFVTESISDNVVDGGVVLEDAQPCFNFEATVTILARVKAPVVSITKQVRKVGEDDWKTKNTANPGDTLEYLITVKNKGNVKLNNLVIGDNMPARMTYVDGTTKLANATFPQGKDITSDNVTTGGIDVGNYSPGANAFVTFKAKIDEDLKPGTYKFKNVAVVDTDETGPFQNFAHTTVVVEGEEEEQPPVPPEEDEQPTPPSEELPVTGPADTALGLMASGGLGYAIRAYARSRKDLLSALLNK